MFWFDFDGVKLPTVCVSFIIIQFILLSNTIRVDTKLCNMFEKPKNKNRTKTKNDKRKLKRRVDNKTREDVWERGGLQNKMKTLCNN